MNSKMFHFVTITFTWILYPNIPSTCIHMFGTCYLYNYVCSFFEGFFGPTGEFFTHMETSPLPVEDFKF